MGLTSLALDAEMPLVRKDSYMVPLTKHLWAIYTPSTKVDGALFIGDREEMEDRLAEAHN
jgi:hypothetical protein